MLSYPEIGEVLGKYKITEILGKGATATVYKASHKFLNVDVALKVLSPKLLQEDLTMKERFLEEAMNHARLSHHNLVKIIDIEHEEKYTYMVMEFIDGATLEEILKEKGPVSPLKAIRIIQEVCIALKHALELNIIHRDIKPGNIIISKSSEVKLMDFGLAKSIDKPDRFQKSDGQIYGTPYYMSPEQFIDTNRIDHRSDLYSLGATLYHLVTGVLPFATDSLSEIISMHINDKPTEPLEIIPKIDPDLSDLIMKLMEKNQADRYQNYLDLLSNLDKIEQDYKYNDLNSNGDNSDGNSDLIQKHQRYQQLFKNFREEKSSENQIIQEANTSVQEQQINDKPDDLKTKPDIENYVSENLQKYFDGLEGKNTENEVTERLKEKYQKYFKQFSGEELEHAVFESSRQKDDYPVQTTTAPKIIPPEIISKKSGNIISSKVILKADNEISKDLNEEYLKFNQENKVKVSASKYIQKFKNLFSK